MLESYRLWHELGTTIRLKLFYQIGLVELGPPDGVVVPGVLRAAAEHNLPVDTLTAREVAQSWPGLRVGHDLDGVL